MATDLGRIITFPPGDDISRVLLGSGVCGTNSYFPVLVRPVFCCWFDSLDQYRRRQRIFTTHPQHSDQLGNLAVSLVAAWLDPHTRPVSLPVGIWAPRLSAEARHLPRPLSSRRRVLLEAHNMTWPVLGIRNTRKLRKSERSRPDTAKMGAITVGQCGNGMGRLPT